MTTVERTSCFYSSSKMDTCFVVDFMFEVIGGVAPGTTFKMTASVTSDAPIHESSSSDSDTEVIEPPIIKPSRKFVPSEERMLRSSHDQVLRKNTRAHYSECGECGESFNSEGLLRKHMASHTAHYSCAECDAVFHSGAELRNHKYIHASPLIHRCSKCEQIFPTSKLLRDHEITHSDKAIRCLICDRLCMNVGGLKYHMRSHNTKQRKATQATVYSGRITKSHIIQRIRK